MRTLKRASMLTMPTARSAERLERTEKFTFPAFLSVASGAEGFIVEPWGSWSTCGAPSSALAGEIRSLLRERLTDLGSRVKA